MEQSEKFSDDLEENLRIENEFLKIKLKAQYGDAFHIENNADMPPEIENQFLKRMMAFEDEYANAEYVTIYERIGKPIFKAVSEMSTVELNAALNKLIKILSKNDIGLDICDGPYADEIIYQFITQELFSIKVEKKPVAGMGSNFIYEEFHPNHKADIIKRTHTFFKNWFSRKFTEYCTELSWHCVTADGEQMTREDIIRRMNVFFEAFTQFKDDGYNIDNLSFDLQEGGKGMGFAEGMLKYDAVMDNGEIIHYEGPYKLYMQMEDNWWSIFYFVMPGFKW
jgi:hypothetical protein